MIPDLGKYAMPVLTAYGATIGLLCAIVALSLWRGARVRRMLRQVEQRQGRTDV